MLFLVGIMPATKKIKGSISKFHGKVCKTTDVSVHKLTEQPSNVCMKKCVSLISKTVKDHDHSMHKYITALPHHRCILTVKAQGSLLTVKCKTE